MYCVRILTLNDIIMAICEPSAVAAPCLQATSTQDRFSLVWLLQLYNLCVYAAQYASSAEEVTHRHPWYIFISTRSQRNNPSGPPQPYPAPAPGIVWPSRGTDILLTWSCTLGPWPFSFALPDLSHTVALFLLLCPPCYTSVVGTPAGGHRPTHNRSL